MTILDQLAVLRTATGERQTVGLKDEVLGPLAEKYLELSQAIAHAIQIFNSLSPSEKELLSKSEAEVCAELQENIVNFYPSNQTNPYIALAAKGPWIVTTHGAVLHDSGGYGMLGSGHGPDKIINAMSKDWVMANVMTPSLSHKRITDRLNQRIGHNHGGSKPIYQKYLFMNSGSEAVTVAMRIADVNAKAKTDPNGVKAGQTIRILAHTGGFHGRTDRPAQASHSTLEKCQALASFRDRKNLLTIEPNNIDSLRNAYAQAEKDGVFIEILMMEPVMGEGNPGLAITPEYYQEARKLSQAHGSLFLIDSIQAGLRAHGVLSVMDYPGFKGLLPPDFETYSKALNAGQYPLSVLAMTDATAAIYKKGIYGNTMTANPRGLETGCAVLDQFSEDTAKNIREKGLEFLEKFQTLAKKWPNVITGVSGTGLLCALHFIEKGYTVVGEKGLEKYMRENGVGVIHGGKNALRFTPHFDICSDEIDLIIETIDAAISRGPVYS